MLGYIPFFMFFKTKILFYLYNNSFVIGIYLLHGKIIIIEKNF